MKYIIAILLCITLNAQAERLRFSGCTSATDGNEPVFNCEHVDVVPVMPATSGCVTGVGIDGDTSYAHSVPCPDETPQESAMQMAVESSMRLGELCALTALKDAMSRSNTILFTEVSHNSDKCVMENLQRVKP